MTTDTIPLTAVAPGTARGARWRVPAALATMALTSFSLVSAEFLPGGVLTQMAADLGITPGQAGQTVTATALVGFVVAPFVGALTPGVDRRRLLVWLALAATVSNVLVAIAPSLGLLLAARVLLGAALSGFWSMSLTVAARVGGSANVARSMVVVNAGTTAATVLGVPLGVLASEAFGWRAVFVAAAAVTLVTAVALRALLPAVPAEAGTGVRALALALRVPGMRQGLAGHVLIVLGHIAAYAFVRVALERVPGVDAAWVAGLLLAFGIGGFVGNLVLGALATKHLGLLRLLVPALIGGTILVLALWPVSLVAVGAAIAAWGFAFGGWLVVISTWAGRQAPERLEAGGGLIVTGFQLAIALGAGLGGVLVDLAGITVALLVAGLGALVGGALFATAPTRPHAPQPRS